MNALFFLSLLKGIQQSQDGRGHAQFGGNGEIYDSVGMQRVGMGKVRRMIRVVQLYGPFDLRKENEILFVKVKGECHVSFQQEDEFQNGGNARQRQERARDVFRQGGRRDSRFLP